MISVDVKHDLGRLSREIALLGSERVAAAVRAINRTMTTLRAEASRTLAEDYAGLKISAIKKRIALWPRANRWNPRAVLSFSNRRLRLTNWQVRQTRVGVGGRLPQRLLLMPAGLSHHRSRQTEDFSRARLRHAFIRASRNQPGIPNVWIRQGRARMPIDLVLAPSLSETLVERRLNQAFGRRARERFAAAFTQEAKFRISKRR